MSTGNFILRTDSYKLSMHNQMPPGTEYVTSYMESRGGQFSATRVFGLQYYGRKYLEGVVITQADIDEAAEFSALHFNDPTVFNRAGWEHILNVHGGKLPLYIEAVPEGTIVPTGNVLMTVTNTDPACYWLVNVVETLLLKLWYPITVCTLSWEIRKVILSYLKKTGSPEIIDFMLQDFGYRGVSSEESAAIGGAAHLVNFQGSDTMAGIKMLRDYYYAPMAGFSVPAMEHSTVTSWGRENEVDAYENMLTQYPTGIAALVGDSYNIFAACEDILGDQLRPTIMNRKGVTVIRPDSGDPVTIVAEVLSILGLRFGYTVNDKGYKVLPPYIRVLQGDGVNIHSIGDILAYITKLGWSTDNIVFGMGGALLQMVNRDTQKFAFKCSSIVVNGGRRDVKKDPITDAGKQSKAGEQKLLYNWRSGAFRTVRKEVPCAIDEIDCLGPLFRDGAMLGQETLANVRGRGLAQRGV